jgi:DmsE family decaheme c-type cytochrome
MMMRAHLTIALVAAALLAAVPSPARAQQNPYRLKETNQQTLCLACHDDFAQKLKKKYVHTAVKAGDCAGCHDPHVSAYPKLLSAAVQETCASCHEGIISPKAKSAHKVVVEGQCQKCHDPHASDHPGNLVSKSTDLCVSCHADIGEAVTKAKFKHSPVQQGCMTCHGPHGSDKAEALLKTGVPALCLGCHKPDAPAFVNAHMRYPVAKASCTSCHDPHGSENPALLPSSVHAPLTSRACAQCHDAPDSATPFATKRPGYELCKGCHNDMVTAMLAKPRLHWPVADTQGCVSCHNPHASKYAKLVKSRPVVLCGSCHAQTASEILSAKVKHAPVDAGECVSCHSPHASTGVYLVDKPSVNELCTQCHDYTTHSAHPIGEKAVDPRNRNLRVDCLSCHKSHGTEHKHLLLAATNTEMCTQCHKQYAR